MDLTWDLDLSTEIKKKSVTNVFLLDADWQMLSSCKLSSVIEIIFSPFWAASQPLVILGLETESDLSGFNSIILNRLPNSSIRRNLI